MQFINCDVIDSDWLRYYIMRTGESVQKPITSINRIYF